MRNRVIYLWCLLAFCCAVSGIHAQGTQESQNNENKVQGALPPAMLPLTKISIFSSGIAYYEHSGTISGPAVIKLPFRVNAVNDALKSLVLNDPASVNPSVSYQSEQTLLQTLRSLKIDLSDNPDIAVILGRLRGAEVEIAGPAPVSGRIMGVERESRISNPLLTSDVVESRLSLLTDRGLQRFNLNEISSLNFKDPEINADLKRALDLIALSRASGSRDLAVNLPGSGSRNVSVSYVIPAPVWKVSYRLDLEEALFPEQKSLFQGWAIIDNDGDSDWNNIELSLVAGRPASFIQNLYPPYYLSRPVQPLAIAGAAEAASHDTGYARPAPAPSSMARSNSQAMMAMDAFEYAMAEEEVYSREKALAGGGVVETARGAAAGDQFEFTVKNPVNLDRRMSAMLPLVEASIEARKLLIFSGANAAGRNHNPRLGAELTNTSGMKLPAGPITVYDGGTYAGDALIEFWNEGEKRLISFGEDLSVTGAVMDTNTRTVTSVTVSNGVMTINRSQDYLKTYIFKNNGTREKPILVEHPKNPGAVLESPEAEEQTPSSYRFTTTLPGEGELMLTVHESRPILERVSLSQLRPESFLSYSSSQEIPPAVRESLRQAIDLRAAAIVANAAVEAAEGRRSWLVSEQERIRKNLEAAGSQTQQGQEYLRRLMSLDSDIDGLVPELDKLKAAEKDAWSTYNDYLNNLNL